MAIEQALNIPYKTVAGVDSNLLSLDVYYLSNETINKPVIVYIHGGAWAVGDKQNIADKGTLFLNNNYLFVSVNYRLSPSTIPGDITTWNANRVKHSTHVQDCADALKWIYDNIESYGGSNQDIVMLGHSAGAHLVALLATNQTYLSSTGFPIASLKGAIINDTEGYDILDQILNPVGDGESGSATPQVSYQNAFGIYPSIAITGTVSPVTIDFASTSAAAASYSTASPINYVSGSTLPMLIASRGNSSRRAKQSIFYNSLISAGNVASKIIVYPDSTSYTHAQINRSIGSSQDPPVGKVLPFGLNNITTEIINWLASLAPTYSSVISPLEALISTSSKLKVDVQKGWHDAIVEMFDIDLSPITGNSNDLYYYTNQVGPGNEKIQWKGITYEPLPILSSGYEKSTTGQIAQPTLTVANILGTFTELISQYDDLVGAKVVRRRTLGKYLDGQAESDFLQEFPIDIYYIERKTEENALSITWELASILDLEGLQLPRRIIIQNLCLWQYRSSECGYTGAPLFNQDDQLISTNGLSPEATTLINTWQLLENRRLQLEAAKVVRNKTFEEKEQACAQEAFLSSFFSILSGNYVLNNRAFVGGVFTPLSSTLRVGNQRVRDGANRYFELENWGFSPATCSGKTVELATADAAVVTATNNYDAAAASYNAAIAALPDDDTIYSLDICAKRVESCKLRFPRQALPFGGFPGASLRQ